MDSSVPRWQLDLLEQGIRRAGKIQLKRIEQPGTRDAVTELWGWLCPLCWTSPAWNTGAWGVATTQSAGLRRVDNHYQRCRIRNPEVRGD